MSDVTDRDAKNDAAAAGAHYEVESSCERPDPLPLGLADGEVS